MAPRQNQFSPISCTESATSLPIRFATTIATLPKWEATFNRPDFEDVVLNAKGPITFYDSVTGKPLFVAPMDRSAQQFVQESKIHGWPSFRDQEVVWDNVRVLKDGETVSVDGTHLG